MRHADILNPIDLHYSKIRTFTGSPSFVAPHFVDQILTALDTNKIYRATGTLAGQLIELAPAGSGGGGGSAIAVSSRPYPSPTTQGSLLFDPSIPAAYIANDLKWMSLSPNLSFVVKVQNIHLSLLNSDIAISFLDGAGNSIINSALTVDEASTVDAQRILQKAITTNGLGQFSISLEFTDPSVTYPFNMLLGKTFFPEMLYGMYDTSNGIQVLEGETIDTIPTEYFDAVTISGNTFTIHFNPPIHLVLELYIQITS